MRLEVQEAENEKRKTDRCDNSDFFDFFCKYGIKLK